eukprot:Sspe_Gene.108402::Locus_87527_Transcript_1_1_Confidence_1.000_Length_1449::g.108402::m.108402
MSQVQGTAAIEAKNINLSLTTLRQVFDVLIANSKRKSGHQVPPYRDSMLTWVLKESLGGNSRTMMIAAISPHEENTEDTISTLRYAFRAKAIVCKVICNEQPSAAMVANLQSQLEDLKAQLETKMSGVSEETREEIKQQYEEEIRAQQQALQEAIDVETKMKEVTSQLEKQVEQLEEAKTEMKRDLDAHRKQK